MNKKSIAALFIINLLVPVVSYGAGLTAFHKAIVTMPTKEIVPLGISINFSKYRLFLTTSFDLNGSLEQFLEQLRLTITQSNGHTSKSALLALLAKPVQCKCIINEQNKPAYMRYPISPRLLKDGISFKELGIKQRDTISIEPLPA